ncbi:MAG: P1 family peptidase [Chloroflexi bacterium]|nr:P1 family peptidase [Chloroflexota bacterium]MCC6893714.1 P1 family peptidase [Anaerolineae bacterium]
MSRPRLRDLGITIGVMPTGTYNAITDVPGVRVGHTTIIADEPRIARTGVTVIFPREEGVWDNHAFAGFHVLNGNGDFTGTHWIEESGLLTSPIAITNTHQVGIVRDTLVQYLTEQHGVHDWVMPLVAETYDGWLNDINAFHVKPEHVLAAVANASSGPVTEGCVGGGTGMICYDFKGGIGTSSRLVDTPSGRFTVGALVQANHGNRELFRVNGVPVGLEIPTTDIPSGWDEPLQPNSIIVIVATDAPLLPGQCKRMAQRVTIGLARTGCVGHNGSGDLFLAFSTGNNVPNLLDAPHDVKMFPNPHMNYLFDGVAEAVEEAVINALVGAETTVGFKGRTAHALPHDRLQAAMARYAPR